MPPIKLPSIDEFADMLDQAIDQIPQRYLRNLTGGFNLQEEVKKDRDYYIMGEYIEEDPLGCFIMFYYGSFAALLKNESLLVWKEEVMETVLHELQHHLESLAGNDDLARQEMEELLKGYYSAGRDIIILSPGKNE